MNLFECILLSVVLISFPLTISFLFVTYSKNINKKENSLLFDLAIFSSTYLLIKFGSMLFVQPLILIIDTVLLISYIKGKKYEAIIISIICLLYYYNKVNINIYFLIIEYVLYYIIYLLKTRFKINDYLFGITILSINSLGLYLYGLNPIYALWMLTASYIIFSFIIFLLTKSEEVLSYHMKYKELEKEKQFRTSLFKITHEIKNPLAVCKGYLDMFDVNNVSHSREYIPIIKNEIEKTLVLLKDFLSINHINLERDVVDINLLLSECLLSLNPLLKAHSVKLLFDRDDEEIYIDADYNRLNQVIINVIKNSIEAQDVHKKSFIKVYKKDYKKKIEIIFEDNGIGISKENLLKIKEPFFTTKHSGSGLGISLSNEIMKAHNGDIVYESTENKGTTVKLILPKKGCIY